jgi:hypothetical protein
VVLAAALTLWMMFSFWLLASVLRLPPVLARIAAILLWAELAALLLWSYGTENCESRTCAPLGQAAGIAARTDIPILAAALTVVAVARLAWRRPATQAGALRGR